MKTDQIMCCIVALLLGMLLANMLKNVCGCKNVVEGNPGGVSGQGQCQTKVRRWNMDPVKGEHGRIKIHAGFEGQTTALGSRITLSDVNQQFTEAGFAGLCPPEYERKACQLKDSMCEYCPPTANCPPL